MLEWNFWKHLLELFFLQFFFLLIFHGWHSSFSLHSRYLSIPKLTGTRLLKITSLWTAKSQWKVQVIRITRLGEEKREHYLCAMLPPVCPFSVSRRKRWLRADKKVTSRSVSWSDRSDANTYPLDGWKVFSHPAIETDRPKDRLKSYSGIGPVSFDHTAFGRKSFGQLPSSWLTFVQPTLSQLIWWTVIWLINILPIVL